MYADSQGAHPPLDAVLTLVKHILPLIPSPLVSLFAGMIAIFTAKDCVQVQKALMCI